MKVTINEIETGSWNVGTAEVVIDLDNSNAVITAQVVLDEGFFFCMTSACVVVTDDIRPPLTPKQTGRVMALGVEVAINEALAEWYEKEKDEAKIQAADPDTRDLRYRAWWQKG